MLYQQVPFSATQGDSQQVTVPGEGIQKMIQEFTGALRERVNIEQRLGGRDAIASATGTYTFDGAAWASVLPLNDAALVQADALSAMPRWQVTMRKREGISQATRLWWRNRYLAVRSVACDPRVPGRMVLATDEVR